MILQSNQNSESLLKGKSENIKYEENYENIENFEDLDANNYYEYYKNFYDWNNSSYKKF